MHRWACAARRAPERCHSRIMHSAWRRRFAFWKGTTKRLRHSWSAICCRRRSRSALNRRHSCATACGRFNAPDSIRWLWRAAFRIWIFWHLCRARQRGVWLCCIILQEICTTKNTPCWMVLRSRTARSCWVIISSSITRCEVLCRDWC